eukprot:7120915-Pyramimonas_sp.AAC.1
MIIRCYGRRASQQCGHRAGYVLLGQNPPRSENIQDTECAAECATMVRNIPRPAFQSHPGDHAQYLNDELVRAVIECFPVQKSPTGRLP